MSRDDLLDLREAFGHLAPDQQLVIRLRLGSGLTFQRIAELHGTSSTTWWRIYCDAIKALRTEMLE
jgi:DNA-directed RNA polymerase specialized sigma24 family protein